MKKIQISAKNVEKAIDMGLKELGVSQDDVEIKILDEGGLFRKAKVELICETLFDEEEAKEEKTAEKETKKQEKTEKKLQKKEDKEEKKTIKAKDKEDKKEAKEEACSLKDFANNYLASLIEKMGVTATLDSVEVEDGIIFSATGEKVNQLIGKRGETLNAIQTVLMNVCRNHGYHEKVYFDVENYKNRREETLISLAERMASKAVRIHKPVKLERMNAYERKIIHTALQEFKGVTTKSEGTEPNRCLVIFPNKD